MLRTYFRKKNYKSRRARRRKRASEIHPQIITDRRELRIRSLNLSLNPTPNPAVNLCLKSAESADEPSGTLGLLPRLRALRVLRGQILSRNSFLTSVSLAQPVGRPCGRGIPAFYTPLCFLHLNVLRKSLSLKHLQRARAIRPAKDAGHFTETMGTSGQTCMIFRVATETMGATAQRCRIVHYYAGFRPGKHR